MQLLTSSKVTIADLGSYYNFAYREVSTSYEWSAREKEATIGTVADYSTGTVTTVQGSSTVTGIGTTFTAAMVGSFIRVADSHAFYKITVFTDATHITIERNL